MSIIFSLHGSMSRFFFFFLTDVLYSHYHPENSICIRYIPAAKFKGIFLNAPPLDKLPEILQIEPYRPKNPTLVLGFMTPLFVGRTIEIKV